MTLPSARLGVAFGSGCGGLVVVDHVEFTIRDRKRKVCFSAVSFSSTRRDLARLRRERGKEPRTLHRHVPHACEARGHKPERGEASCSAVRLCVSHIAMTVPRFTIPLTPAR